jgi:hypothetical protein
MISSQPRIILCSLLSGLVLLTLEGIASAQVLETSSIPTIDNVSCSENAQTASSQTASTPTKPNAKPAPLPAGVANAVLKQARSRSTQKTPPTIVRAEPQTWPDGCLGLSEPDQFCTQMLTPGWRVTVQTESKQTVYRANETGTVVKQENKP